MRQILALLFISNINLLIAQQNVQFTEYDANLSMYNPAITGIIEDKYANITVRDQWVGITANPMAIMGLYEQNLGLNSMGGGYMYHELGYEQNNSIWLNYARTLKFDNVKINLGSSLTYARTFIKGSDLVPANSNDLSIQSYLQDDVAHTLGLGVGAAIYNDKFESGVSLINLSPRSLNFGLPYNRMPHLYVNGAYKIQTSSTKWRISALMKTNFSSTTVEAQVRTLIKNRFYLGAGARNTKAFHGIIGLQFFENFRIACLYEYWYSNLPSSAHTFSINLSWRIANE